MTSDKNNPVFSHSLFWDININTLDMDKHAGYIIERVLEYGQWEDWLKIKEFYSLNKIIEVATNLRSLEPSAMTFIATISNTSLEEFKCYRLIQSNLQPWTY